MNPLSFEAVSDAVRALGVAVFVPRCIACDEAMTVGTDEGLCEPCQASLEPGGTTPGRRCCEVCDEQLQGSAPICGRCSEDPPPFSTLRGAYLYGGALAEAMSQTKFRRREDVGEKLGDLLASALPTAALVAGADMLVPVPLALQRRWTRGYNQSGLLARAVADRHDLPVRYALRRTRHTAPQSDLLLQERVDNVAGAFTASSLAGSQEEGPVVVLVDDVATSCSTARSAAQALRNAGAREVRVLTLLRRG